MQRNIVITATDTDVGKTVFSAGLVQILGAHYWKPIQAGEPHDTKEVARLSGASVDRLLQEAVVLQNALCPSVAAQIEGVEIPCNINIPKVDGTLIIEGAGGLMVPINGKTTMLDLFERWRQPTILCARTGLGTINHTLLSIMALQERRIPIMGIAFIGDKETHTIKTIESFSGQKILGRIPIINKLDCANLKSAMKDFKI